MTSNLPAIVHDDGHKMLHFWSVLQQLREAGSRGLTLREVNVGVSRQTARKALLWMVSKGIAARQLYLHEHPYRPGARVGAFIYRLTAEQGGAR